MKREEWERGGEERKLKKFEGTEEKKKTEKKLKEKEYNDLSAESE